MKELDMSRYTMVYWSSFYREINFDTCFKKKLKSEVNLVKLKLSKVNLESAIPEKSSCGRPKGIWRHWGALISNLLKKRIKKCSLVLLKILPNITIISDCWKLCILQIYMNIKMKDYKHFKVNHSINFKDPNINQYKNMIEGLWRHGIHSLS